MPAIKNRQILYIIILNLILGIIIGVGSYYLVKKATEENPKTKSKTTRTYKQGEYSSSKVWITKNGKKYHREGCNSLKGTKISISVDDAKARGLTPCKMCKPD